MAQTLASPSQYPFSPSPQLNHPYSTVLGHPRAHLPLPCHQGDPGWFQATGRPAGGTGGNFGKLFKRRENRLPCPSSCWNIGSQLEGGGGQPSCTLQVPGMKTKATHQGWLREGERSLGLKGHPAGSGHAACYMRKTQGLAG